MIITGCAAPAPTVLETPDPVTVEQIGRLSEARDISLQILDANSDEFVHWNEQKVTRGDLIEFVRRAY